MMQQFIEAFVAQLRVDAAEREAEGSENSARAFRAVADRLEREARRFLTTPLALADAVKLSGYSADRLSKLVSQSRITLRPCDLPRKPRRAKIGNAAEPDRSRDPVDSIITGRIAHQRRRQRA